MGYLVFEATGAFSRRQGPPVPAAAIETGIGGQILLRADY